MRAAMQPKTISHWMVLAAAISALAAAGCQDAGTTATVQGANQAEAASPPPSAPPAPPSGQAAEPPSGAQPASPPSGAPPAGAQPPQPAQPTAGGGAEISDAQLKKFVAVFKEVNKIQQGFQAKMAEVKSQEDAAKMQQAAREQIDAAIEANGMSVEDYRSIASQANQDQNLRARLTAEMQ